MNHELLTPDRIEAARDALNDPYIDVVDDGEESRCILYQDSFEEAMVTAIAALDFVKQHHWRDPKVEPPTGDEEYPVWAVLNDNEPELMWYVPKARCACFWRREYRGDRVVSAEAVWYRWITAYMPLPEWEETKNDD